MAIADTLRNLFTSNVPFGGAPATLPTDQALGHTAPQPAVDELPRPTLGGRPYGQSGRGNFWGLPQPDELNRELIGPAGLRRFDEIYRTDAHARRLILMAWAPIVTGTWGLEPYGGDEATDLDREVADTIWWGLTKHMSPNFYSHLATAGPLLLRSGFTPFEQLWDSVTYKGKQLVMPRKLDVRLPRTIWRWWQDDYGELSFIGQILPNKADVVIPASELVYYRLGDEGDNWQGVSLLRHCYKNWYMKDKLERLDVIGQERKAVGVPIIYPPKGAPGEQKDAVAAMFADMHLSQAVFGMMPGPKAGSQGANGNPNDEWLVDIVQFNSSADSGMMASLQYHTSAMESSFAQDFMSLGHHQVGARATADVQEDPYLTAVDALLETTVKPPAQRLVERIAALNWGDKLDGVPTLSCSLHDSASLTEIAGYLQSLVAADVIQPDPELEDWAREHADLPPANQEIRGQRLKAQQAGFEQAANGQVQGQPGEPSSDGTPASSGEPVSQGEPTSQGKPGSQGEPQAAQPGKQLDAATEPTAKWFERLLSQDKLREAFDGARDHIQARAEQPVLTLAAQVAHQAANDGKPNASTAKLAGTLTQHYTDLYQLGHQTVTDELARQRRALGTTLDTGPGAAAGAGVRAGRAKQRGDHSASNILAKVREQVGRARITGLKDPGQLQQVAQKAALGQLRVEALANTAAMVNDGRADAATNDPGVIGAYYTSVLDGNTCDPCQLEDNGQLLGVNDALAVGPPNPECEGGDYCRCALVWVLSDDPAALQAA